MQSLILLSVVILVSSGASEVKPDEQKEPNIADKIKTRFTDSLHYKFDLQSKNTEPLDEPSLGLIGARTIDTLGGKTNDDQISNSKVTDDNSNSKVVSSWKTPIANTEQLSGRLNLGSIMYSYYLVGDPYQTAAWHYVPRAPGYGRLLVGKDSNIVLNKNDNQLEQKPETSEQQVLHSDKDLNQRISQRPETVLPIDDTIWY